MFREQLIAQGLAELGYLRVKKLTYKASWSSADVEHLLLFTLYGGGNYLAAEFGLRNPAAQHFAIECLRLYGGPLFHNYRVDPYFHCPMQFSLGRIAGWPSRSSLIASKMAEAALAERVKHDVKTALFPIVRSVLSNSDLFSLLVKDVEPCRWYKVSGALRAAMVVYLGRRIGMSVSDMTAMLQPYLKDVGAAVDSISPEVFLERVLRHPG